MKRIYNYSSLLLSLLFLSCSGGRSVEKNFITYDSFKRVINIPAPQEILKAKFNRSTASDSAVIENAQGEQLSGFITSNKEFLEIVIMPALLPYIDSLRSMPRQEMINSIILFSHEIYQTYFGKDFYRWGGDMLDLDDPQNKGVRYSARYGLDCSGFATSAYEIALYMGLLQPEDPGALFSSKGFELYCRKNNVKDTGSRNGGANRFRLDTSDLALLGTEVFTVAKGGSPSAAELELLHAGDLVGRSGHFGIIVIINQLPYYLESGGWVLPKNGGNPHNAGEALQKFARNGKVSIRRAL